MKPDKEPVFKVNEDRFTSVKVTGLGFYIWKGETDLVSRELTERPDSAIKNIFRGER